MTTAPKRRPTSHVVLCPKCNKRIKVRYDAPPHMGAGAEPWERIVCTNPKCKHAFSRRLPGRSKK